jgi:DNA polymerase-3 subunit alpha
LPTLTELHQFLFQIPFSEAHNATADVEATTRCFLELIRLGHFALDKLQRDESYLENFKAFNPSPIELIGLKHINLKEESLKLKQSLVVEKMPFSTIDKTAFDELDTVPFAHLHNHTQFSILQSTIDVKGLVNKAAALNMPAVALTDTGNMMAAFHFEKAVSAYNKTLEAERQEALEKGEEFTKKELLPIIGCEFNVCKDLTDKKQKDVYGDHSAANMGGSTK